MFFRTIFIISVLFSVVQLKGQRIKVISSSDHTPIEHVAVFNKSRERAAITDTLGMIDLSIFPDSDTIIFQHPSYNTVQYIRKQISGQTTIVLDRKRILIEEYVISASKSRESKLIIPYMVDVLERSTLRETTGLTAAEILESTGNIVVQRTQGGGGSPILRGFEANRILLVVDGVRLNNAIYRSGHLQNSITIDHSILDRTEVIFGPSSIMYGSDALGGVIHYYTTDPCLSEDQQARLEVQAYTQYATAMHGKTGHLDFSLGKKHWGTLTSITYKDLGDIRIGKRRSPYLGDWGKVMHYVDQVDGMDSTIANENPLIQKNTGYRQLDILQKFRYAPSQYVDWILNMQYSTSSDIDRLDKLNDYNGNNLKYASYYYGPQDRFFISLKNVLKKDNRIFTNMTTIVAFQKIDEDRNSRKFRNEELLSQREGVNVFNLNMDLLKVWSASHKLNYGLEFNHNTVSSQAWYKNIYNGEQRPAQTRYPEGGSQTWSASAYASYKWILSKQLVLSGGSRYNWAGLTSSFNNTILSYDRIDISNGALTGSLGLVYTPTDRWQLNTILSSGFRNPNVDDYGKVRAKDGFVTVPNEELAPEYSYNAEIGISRIVEGYMKIELVGYYTYLKDAIVRTGYQLNGQDSLHYDGDYYLVTTNYNTGQGYIYGASMSFTSNLNPNIILKGTLNYTRGHNITDDVPLGHIPPIFGRTSLTYRKSTFFVDTYIVYHGWKQSEDFSPYGEDNDEEAMAYGFPSWWTANMKVGFNVGSHFDFMLAIENLFDQFYKPYASGISSPGRNFLLTARFTL
ncbi:MAG: TonB-dependent receptor [Bacteroidales bacterium]|nr:TonB-dependent receptor [Bacteroidales bacterium]